MKKTIIVELSENELKLIDNTIFIAGNMAADHLKRMFDIAGQDMQELHDLRDKLLHKQDELKEGK